ncbi:unnamed protein product [Nezara viridula]|uniref:Uncharacterized protein n=1 Tax=Nezara viridula TaxID=85310 RepID=A0A9P0HFY4_NEZVI|nr:unnamed protein product [Nezara viridula]
MIFIQQDSAPAQLSSGCKRTFQSSSLPRIGPSGSTDLNPPDYRLWSELEMACHRAHPNLESLKQSLVRAVEHFPQEVLGAAIDDWARRLNACVKGKGGHFE